MCAVVAQAGIAQKNPGEDQHPAEQKSRWPFRCCRHSWRRDRLCSRLRLLRRDNRLRRGSRLLLIGVVTSRVLGVSYQLRTTPTVSQRRHQWHARFTRHNTSGIACRYGPHTSLRHAGMVGAMMRRCCGDLPWLQCSRLYGTPRPRRVSSGLKH